MVVLYLVTFRVFSGAIFFAGNMIYNNSVPDFHLGIANGIAMGYGGLGS